MNVGLIRFLQSCILCCNLVVEIVIVQAEVPRKINISEVFLLYYSSLLRLRNHTYDPSDYFIIYLRSSP